jgi:hypothetical protein
MEDGKSPRGGGSASSGQLFARKTKICVIVVQMDTDFLSAGCGVRRSAECGVDGAAVGGGLEMGNRKLQVPIAGWGRPWIQNKI